jgi:putative ABC transport system substrate-binding protein
MKRRELLSLLAGAAAWPLAARAQNAKAPVRLGFVPLGSPSNAYDSSLVEAFRQGLSRVGLIENRDIILDVAWVDGDPDQALRDVLRRGAEVLIPCGSSASVAAKRQTSTIPIVFVSVGDPIAMGLVASLPRPEYNATGFSDILADLSGKAGGPFQGADQAANNDRLSLAHRMAGRSKSLPAHRASCPGSWNEPPVKGDRRYR